MWRSARIIWLLTRDLSRSFTRSSEPTDRLATYDFLLVVHSLYGFISYCFQDKSRFQLKITTFSTPVYLMPPQPGFPLEFYNGSGTQKNQNDVPPRLSKFVDHIAHLCRQNTTLWTDRQTDRQTQCISIMLCIAY